MKFTDRAIHLFSLTIPKVLKVHEPRQVEEVS